MSFTNPSIVLLSAGKLAIENRPFPVISDSRNVLVQVASTGICGSDVHYYKHGRIGSFVVKKSLVLGHESAGTVTSVGPSVTKLKVGDRVAMEPGIPCRYCRFCQQGIYNLCASMSFAATPPIDGTLCGVFQLPQDLCYSLPASLSLDEGAMAEPLSVAVHVMLTQAHVGFGESVVVIGAGPIGLLCCAVSQAFGADKIVSVDINESRLRFARKYAATDTFNATRLIKSPPEESAIVLATDVGLNHGYADIVVDASGAESSIQLGVHLTKPGGTFVQVGMGRDNVDFPISAVCSKELNIRGSFRYGPGNYETAIKLMEGGKVDVKPLITRILPFEHAEEAFKASGQEEGIKTIIRGPSVSRSTDGCLF